MSHDFGYPPGGGSGGAVSSVAAADGTVVVSPTTGAVTVRRAAITGDVAIAAASNAATLANTGVGAGTYAFPSSVTVDSKGRITAIAGGSQPVVALTSNDNSLCFVENNPGCWSGIINPNITTDYCVRQYIHSSDPNNAALDLMADPSQSVPVLQIHEYCGTEACGINFSVYGSGLLNSNCGACFAGEVDSHQLCAVCGVQGETINATSIFKINGTDGCTCDVNVLGITQLRFCGGLFIGTS